MKRLGSILLLFLVSSCVSHDLLPASTCNVTNPIDETVEACQDNCGNEERTEFTPKQFPDLSPDDWTNKMREIYRTETKNRSEGELQRKNNANASIQNPIPIPEVPFLITAV